MSRTNAAQRRDSRTLEDRLNDSWGEMGFNRDAILSPRASGFVADDRSLSETPPKLSNERSARFSPMRRSRNFTMEMPSSMEQSPPVSLMPKMGRRNSSWLLVPSAHGESRHVRRAERRGSHDEVDPNVSNKESSLGKDYQKFLDERANDVSSPTEVEKDRDSFAMDSEAGLPPPPLVDHPSIGFKKEKAELEGRRTSSATAQQQYQHRVASQQVSAPQPESFAMRSIERGTDAWNTLLEPFVSDLVFQSVIPKRKGSKSGNVTFRPHHCQAALLFVDLSGYSKITSALAYAGAHAISECVNSYLARLVHVLKHHGGDVVKFAGDALMVVWAGDPSELEVNVFCAARAALSLQKRCGVHPVPGTEHQFKIHCGLTCGTLDSEVFCAPKQNQCMPRLYHALSGETVEEIGDLVDLAASGELCISQNCVSFLEGSGRYQDIAEEKLREFPTEFGAKLLTDLVLEPDLVEYIDGHIGEVKNKSSQQRKALNSSIAEDFIHKSVLDALQHGGLSPTQIAQMRELCVLFIAMTSSGDAVNWLVEVQEILDRNRCPIVQIIHDDKGVHIVAAINLYEASPETPLLGLKVCRELALKRVGASVGMAIGPSFCGVTGSSEACRWDITGPAVVRAARLMQYALSHGVHFAIDQTLSSDPKATTYMTLVDSNVQIKGSRDNCSVYTISESQQHSASRIMDSNHVPVHESLVDELHRFIVSRGRGAVVVTGAPLVGKKMVCQRAAGKSGLVPYMHVCDASDEFASIARTIATWFQYADDEEVQKMAKRVLDDMENSRWTCAHGQCVSLVDLALQKGFRACFLVDRIQHLDEFSLSIIRDCIQTQYTPSHFSGMVSMSTICTDKNDSPTGKLCFLCVHVPLYGSKSATNIAQDITRSLSSLYVPVVEVGEASVEDLRTLFHHICDVEAEDRLLNCYAESSGYAAGYFIERVLGILSVGGESVLVETNANFKLQVPRGMINMTKELSVTQVCPQIATRFSQVYDDLPLVCQLVLKIVGVANKDYRFPLNQSVIEEVLNRLIEDGIQKNELDEFIDEMVEVRVLKLRETRNEQNSLLDREISIRSPALADIAKEVCTPAQFEIIATALADCLQSSWTDNFQTALVCAGLHETISNNEGIMQQMWRQAFFSFLCESEGWPEVEINKWKEAITDAIQTVGFSAKEVLGEEISVPCPPRISIRPSLSLLKTYTPPLALGPLGYTFSIMCRNVFQELGKFQNSAAGEYDHLYIDMESACGRYMMQVSMLEEFLQGYDLKESTGSLLEEEFEMLTLFCSPASSQTEVERKASLFLDKMIPSQIRSRRERLCDLVLRLRSTGELPVIMITAPKALRLAYEALQVDKNRSDAAQDALMILATSNWTPHPTPEFMPFLHQSQQSIPNLRDQTLMQWSKLEASSIQHQQSVDDLEAFLLVTALLYEEDHSERF